MTCLSAGEAERKLPGPALVQPLEKMLAAQRDVAVVAADLGLLRRERPRGPPRRPGGSSSPCARIRRRPSARRACPRARAAPPTRETAWPGSRCAGRSRAPGISSWSATSQSCSTCALRQELRLVDQDAVDRALLQLARRSRRTGRCFRRKYAPAADKAMREPIVPDARAVVERRGPQHRLHAALAIVEVGLQQGRRFPRVHRRIVEIELGHRSAASVGVGDLEAADAHRVGLLLPLLERGPGVWRKGAGARDGALPPAISSARKV